MSAIEDEVIIKIAKRSIAGVNKYGTTMERTDLSRWHWLRHAQEEAMDLSVYLERLIQEEKRQEQALAEIRVLARRIDSRMIPTTSPSKLQSLLEVVSEIVTICNQHLEEEE